MPYHELISYLTLNDDAVVSYKDGVITTEKGLRYIESREGMVYYNSTYKRRTIWCRE